MRWRKIVATAYAVVALATFGVAARSYSETAWARYSVCQSVSPSQSDTVAECRSPWTIDAPVVGLVSGALWPLWWSWTAVEAIEGER